MKNTTPFFFSYFYRDFNGNNGVATIIMEIEKSGLTPKRLERVLNFIETEHEFIQVEILNFIELSKDKE